MKKTGTREWSNVSFNIQTGCEHDCIYCYAKANAIRFKRATPVNWKHPIAREIPDKGLPRRTLVMFPTAHDITSENVLDCLRAIQTLILRQNKVLVVTKANFHSMDCLTKSLARYRNEVEFRITIGSPHDYDLGRWEPHAPTFEDRLKSLQLAFSRNYKTSVSAEPLLCKTRDFPLLYNAVRPYATEGVWVGKLNNCGGRIGVNTAGDESYNIPLHLLMSDQNDENILSLYNRYKNNSQVKWKDSIRAVVAKHMEVIEQ